MGAVACRPLPVTDLQKAELRVQELSVENELLRRSLRAGGGIPPPRALPHTEDVPQPPPSDAVRLLLGQEEIANYFLAPQPAAHAAARARSVSSAPPPPQLPSCPATAGAASGAAASSANMPMLPALAPDDLEAMIKAAPKDGNVDPLAVRAAAAERLPGLPARAPLLLRVGRLPGSGEERGLGAERQWAFLREVQVLSSICHEHLVPLVAFSMPCLATVHPWPEHGNLGHLLRHCPPDPLVGFHIVSGAAKGVRALHELGLVHRDVKSAGVYLYGDADWEGGVKAKLGDCGFVNESDVCGGQSSGEIVGTPIYADPIHLFTGRYFKASDIFSLGVVVLEVLLGRSAAQLGEPGARSDQHLGAVAGHPKTLAAAATDEDLGTRRPRAPPLWLQFDQQVPKGPEAASAAADLVLSARPRPDWSKKALSTATGLVLEMLKVNDADRNGSGPPSGRPMAGAVVEELEVATALQDCCADPVSEPRRERICIVCMDQPIDTQLLPCGHSALCQACAAVFVGREEKCPICRRKARAFKEGDYLSTFVQPPPEDELE